MKKTIRLFGFIAFVAVIIFGFTACPPDGGGSSHTHTWGAWNVEAEDSFAATCTATGVGTRVCTVCGVADTDTEIPKDPDAHVWGDWDEDAEDYEAPTCVEQGTGTRECTECEVADTNTVIPALGHDWEWKTTTPATFIAAGEETETCKHDSEHTTNETRPLAQLPITTAANWTSALTQLNGKTGEYTLTIGGNFIVAGRNDSSFGTTADGPGLKVTLKGSGTLSLTVQGNAGTRGNILRIGANQTLIIDSKDLTLRGMLSGQYGATQNNTSSVVYVENGGTLELQNGTVTGNWSITTNYSSGVHVSSGGTFTMHGGKISDNTIGSYGGGVYVAGGTFTMKGGEISYNTTANPNGNNRGGGVCIDTGGTFTMEGGEISNNTASTDGGGVYVDDAIFIMKEGGKISYNTTTGNGGGVYLRNSTFTMKGGEISNNTANSTTYGGGGVYLTTLSGGTCIFTMEGGVISKNTAVINGGGVYNSATFRIVTGTIYGSDNAELGNTSGYNNGASSAWNGTADLGTYVDGEWVSKGTQVSTTKDTVKVLNGEIVQ
jgi:hypothetical protein